MKLTRLNDIFCCQHNVLREYFDFEAVYGIMYTFTQKRCGISNNKCDV